MRQLTVGRGRPALLLPGNDLAQEFYVPFAEALARRGLSTRLLTLPGFRGTPRLACSGLRPLIDAVAGELESCCTPSGILIGHSFGGLLAFFLAAEHAARIDALVLLEPAIIPSEWLARRAARRYRNDVVTGSRSVFENWSGTFRRLHDPDRFPRWAIDHYLAVRAETDPEIMCGLLDDLPSLYPLPFERVTMPVLVLRGASSGAWVRFGTGRLARRLSRATLLTIEGAAHWMINEQDEAIASAIDRFIGSRGD